MSDAFSRLSGALDTAMVVVTAATADERSGCLVGFHCQCSIHPPRYAVWVSKQNHTYGVAIAAEHLAVHFLDHDDRDIAELFGTLTGDEVDKFALCDVTSGPGGAPVVTRVRNRLVGRRVSVTDDGSDHVCVVIEPVDVVVGGEFSPLRLSDIEDLEPGHSA